jgi:hypothetical protein
MAINTDRAVHPIAFMLHVVLFAVQGCCNPVYFPRNTRPEKKASHDDSASCNCG